VSAAPSLAAPTRLPSASPHSPRRIWSIGGGKGGIGKSLLAASLGTQLARMGKRVVLVDADLGGANLHT
jgi:flagellar biosynthesis protein FlhG